MVNWRRTRVLRTGTWPVVWWPALAGLLFVLVAARECAVSADLRGPVWANVWCAAVIAAPIVAGRRYPVVAVTLGVAAVMSQTTWLTPSTRLAMPLLGMLAAAYTAGRHVDRRGIAVPLLALCLAEEWAGPIAVNHDPIGDAVFVTVALWAVWLLGRSLLTREHLAEEERARLRAEAEQQQRVRAAVVAERQAIARDLHDTVSHAVTLMVLHATGTRLVARAQPDKVVDALQVIEKAGRQAMEDLRAMLHVLRHDDADGHDMEPAAAGPTLEDLHELVQGARDSGVDVTVDDHTIGAVLARSQSAAAYRTVQEGLTNAARHAPGAPVHVTVRTTPGRLAVTVDNGPPSTFRAPMLNGAGAGLIGLRERVAALGGSLHAARRPDRGFTLSIELPGNIE